MNIDEVMALSPYLEVAIRHTYWHSEPLVRFVSERRARSRKVASTQGPKARIEAVVANLARRGVAPGDLLVVHSAYKPLSGGSRSPADVNAALKALVGEAGTLALPAIPRFDDAPAGVERLHADVSELVLDYDPIRTPAWTGALPSALMKAPGSRRSSFPLNSLVALGPAADAMFAHELEGDRPMPCGPGSAWNYCRLHGAKIAALGVDMAHSLTMIHVAEDVLGDDWYVPGWYRDRRFRVRLGDDWRSIVVRERHPKWALHYGERTLDKDLRREGLLTVEQVEGVDVALLDAGALVDYLNHRNRSGYPYFLASIRARRR